MDVVIAGRALREFDAKINGYPAIESCEINAGVFQGVNRSSMQLLHNMRGMRSMSFTVDFYGKNSYDRTKHQSEFESLFLALEPVRIDVCDGYWYKAVLTKSTSQGTKDGLIASVEYTFNVTRHRGEEVVATVQLNRDKIWCQSNVAVTDCIISIPYDEDIHWTTVRLNGKYDWKIWGEKGDVVLDGVNKVYKLGEDVANSTVEWTDFPFLVPGENTISLWLDSVMVTNMVATVRYTPTFL